MLVVLDDSDDMRIEETVISRTAVFKYEHLFVFEVSWRDHGSQTIARMVDGVEEQVVCAVIHCSQEDFTYVVKQTRGCLEFYMMMEFRDRNIFLGPSRALLGA